MTVIMDQQENCPICWRDFSLETRPVCLPCGHSTCFDCSQAIRTCSLCRCRISNNFQRNTNFALLSIIEKRQQQQNLQRTSQQTQTDLMETVETRPTRARQGNPLAMLEGKTIGIQIKRAGIQLSIK